VKLGLYDADAEIQSLNVECPGPGIRYAGACNLSIIPDVARRLRLNPDSLRMNFYGWNILSEAADGQIVNMTWDSLGFKAFEASEKRGVCAQSPRKNVSEAFFMERAEGKAAFYAGEAVRRHVDSLARRDSLAADELLRAQERARHLAEEKDGERRLAKDKRKRIFRTVRIGLGTVLATSAAITAWNGNSQSQQAETSADRYKNSLSVESARINKDEYYRHSRKAQWQYLAGGLMFAVSIPLVAF
jgi:hypothetical protein